MSNYPPVDPDFYSIGAASGMSDEDIQKDWEAYCDDLKKFHTELDAQQEPSAPEPKPDTLTDIKKMFGAPSE